MTTIRICRLEDIPRLGARRYCDGERGTIAIFRTADDRVFALRDSCPHKGGPLSQGIVFGESVACPLHNWSIDLTSGQAAAPDVGSVERFEVQVVEGEVRLSLDRHSAQECHPREGPECHSRVGGNPMNWAPACAGATKNSTETT